VIDQDIILEVLLFKRILRTHHTHMAAVRSLGEDAKSIMISHPITITSDIDLCDAADLMLKHHINRACVVDDGKLVGIVSKRDVINAVYRIGGLG
jgi:CBS domain-containing protein